MKCIMFLSLSVFTCTALVAQLPDHYTAGFIKKNKIKSITIATPDFSGDSTKRTTWYDSNGLDSVVEVDGSMITEYLYTRDGKGRIARVDFLDDDSNPQYKEYSYAANGSYQVKLRWNNDLITSDYDQSGRLLRVVHAGYTDKYHYDEKAKLVRVTYKTPNPSEKETLIRQYNWNGNQLISVDRINNGMVDNYTYNSKGLIDKIATVVKESKETFEEKKLYYTFY